MADDSLLVWCDVRKNIGAVQLVVGLYKLLESVKDCCRNTRSVKTEMRLLPQCLLVRCTRGKGMNDTSTTRETRKLVAFKDLKINPKTCNGLSLEEGDELHMRLQMNVEGTDPTHQLNVSINCLEDERRSLKQGPVNMTCRMCGSDVFCQQTHFKRVLELPSENWQQMSKDLYCHGTSIPSLAFSSLNPGEGDCLLGSYYIVVHSTALETKNIIIVQGETTIRCSRCRKPLGDVVIQQDGVGDTQVKGIRINKHAICSKDNNIFSDYSLEVFIARSLLAKLQGRVNFKFLLKGHLQNGKSKTYALLWLLNADAAVITNIGPYANKYLQHHMEQRSKGNTSNQSEVSLTHTLKVLYKVVTKGSDQECKEALAGNTHVDTLLLAEEECLHLLLILATSSLAVPPSLREINGFTVGFLKT